MNKIVIKPEFEAKLQNLGIKDKFLKNCRNPNYNINTYIKELNEVKTWYDFITQSFCWKNTPEGFEYWQNIANK
jgi:hypothetical protein